MSGESCQGLNAKLDAIAPIPIPTTTPIPNIVDFDDDICASTVQLRLTDPRTKALCHRMPPAGRMFRPGWRIESSRWRSHLAVPGRIAILILGGLLNRESGAETRRHPN